MKCTLFVVMLVLLTTPSFAGVVYEIENRNMSTETMQTSSIAVEGSNLKMVIDSGEGKDEGEMIFRGEKREMIVVNHNERSYMVLDEDTMNQLAEQMKQASAALAEMEKALANVPESQRAQVEKMMRSRLPNMSEPVVPTELRKTGDEDTMKGYPCMRYEILRDGVVIRELWVTDWSNVEGGEDTSAAFQAMADFVQQMIESLPQFGQMGQSSASAAFEHMRGINGFPVLTREFADDGSLESIAALTAVEQTDLSAADFEPDPRYKRQEISMK
ncbi:MAG: DUF4412 domain-containing protein [Holophagae bacterium]|jgi:hypothetical protein